MTTDHLPECIYAPRNVDPDKGIEWGGSPCICDALRACEQRVRDELFPLRWGRAEQLEEARVNGWHAGWNAALEDGYAAGLDAARDAVAALANKIEHPWASIGDALAAIDALRNPPSLPPTTGRAHKY